MVIAYFYPRFACARRHSSWLGFHPKPSITSYACQHHVRRTHSMVIDLLILRSVGAVLYTSYLQALASLHEPSAKSAKRVYPPPDPRHTFTAGFVAGSVQSVVAAPLDALQVRFKTSEMLEGRYQNMWCVSLQYNLAQFQVLQIECHSSGVLIGKLWKCLVRVCALTFFLPAFIFYPDCYVLSESSRILLLTLYLQL